MIQYNTMADYGRIRRTVCEINDACRSIEGAACLRLGCRGLIETTEGALVCSRCGYRYREG